MKLSKKELMNIKAGANITASLLNYLIKGFSSFLDIGRYLGSSIRRFTSNNNCPLK